jgi:hypothetical protein
MDSGASSQTGKSGALSTLFKQLWKNIETLPGWVPLLVCYQLSLASAPEDAAFFGISIRSHLELFIGILTFISYQLGDAIDKPLFGKWFKGSRLEKSLVSSPREDVQKELQVQEGIYQVAKSLLTAGDQYDGTWVHFCNELSKFLRSILIPLLFLPLLPVFVPSIPLVWRVLLAVIFFVSYVFLKSLHMRLLYERTNAMVKSDKLTKSPKYETTHLDNEIRLFFWDGKFVVSARHKQFDRAAPFKKGS